MSLSVTYCDTLNRYAIHLEQSSIYLSKEEGELLTASLLTLGKGKDESKTDMLVDVILHSLHDLLAMASFDVPDIERAKHDMHLIEAACDSLQGVNL